MGEWCVRGSGEGNVWESECEYVRGSVWRVVCEECEGEWCERVCGRVVCEGSAWESGV